MGNVGAVIAFDPSNAQNLNDIKPMFSLGATFSHTNGKTYRYVRHDDGVAVATAAGGAAYWLNRATGTVTSDKTSSAYGAAVGAGVAGIYQGVVTDQRYTWLVTEGAHVVMLAAGDSNGAVGNKIFAPVTDVNLTLRSEAEASVAAGEITATEIGRQIAAGSGDTALVALMID